MEIIIPLLLLLILISIFVFFLGKIFKKTDRFFYRPRLFIRLQEQEAMVIEKMGKFNRVIYRGVKLIFPFLEGPRRIFYHKELDPEILDLRDVVFDFKPLTVITGDKATITIDGFIIVKIIDPKRLAYQVENFPDAIERLTEAGLRDVIGGMEMDKTLTSREEISEALKNHLLKNTETWGVKIKNAEIQELSPDKEIVKAMNAQNVAMRNKFATFEKAEGEARMLKEASDVLGDEKSASKYLATLRYVEAFKELVTKKDGKVVFIPYEGGNLTSSLSFMKEFFTGEEKTPAHKAKVEELKRIG